MPIDLKIPVVGESITEVQISEWLKSEGDLVKADEPVAVIDSEKTTFDLPAPQAGRLTKILHQAGETITIGTVVAQFEAAGEAAPATATPPPSAIPAPTPAAASAEKPKTKKSPPVEAPKTKATAPAAPKPEKAEPPAPPAEPEPVAAFVPEEAPVAPAPAPVKAAPKPPTPPPVPQEQPIIMWAVGAAPATCTDPPEYHGNNRGVHMASFFNPTETFPPVQAR